MQFVAEKSVCTLWVFLWAEQSLGCRKGTASPEHSPNSSTGLRFHAETLAVK